MNVIKRNSEWQPTTPDVRLMNGHDSDIRKSARALARSLLLEYVLA